jgi:hypothetical protein
MLEVGEVKRTPLVRKTPLKARRATGRRDDGRIQHARTKGRAKEAPTALERKHHARLREKPCCVPGCTNPSILHHIMHMDGKERRRDHRYVVNLCPTHHNMGDLSVHLLGGEARFLAVHMIDLVAIAVNEWEFTINHIDATQ